MTFELVFTDKAGSQLDILERFNDKKTVLKAVRKTLAFLETNLRHPSLQTHEYRDLVGANGEKVFDSYAEQNTPAAYRVFWYYGPEKNKITVVSVTSHP